MPPFAYVEQRELIYLRALKATTVHVAAIVAVRVRGSHTGTTNDTLASLAGFGGMSVMSMRRAVHWLTERGLLTESRERRKGGPQGSGWVWRRRVLPYELWPLPKSAALPDRLSPKSGSQGAPLEKSRSESDEEPLREAGRAAQTTRDNPDVPPEVLPDDDGEERRLRAGLTALEPISWYPHDELSDRAMLLDAVDLNGLELADEIARWVTRCTKEHPRQPRAALRAWLLKAPAIRAQRRTDREIVEKREELPPRTYEQLLAIKAAGGRI